MTMQGDKFEREFESFLTEDDSRFAALYRNLPQAEPDARLDAAIKSMARRASMAQTGMRPLSAARRWLPALGAAAGIVFAAGIAYRLSPTLRADRNEIGTPVGDVIGAGPSDAPSSAIAPLISAKQKTEVATTRLDSETRAAAGKTQGSPAAKTAGAMKSTPMPLREKFPAGTETAPGQPAVTGGSSKTENAAAFTERPQAFPPPAEAGKSAVETDALERKQSTDAAPQDLQKGRSDGTGKDATPEVPAAPAAAFSARQAPSTPQLQEETRATTTAPLPASAPAPISPSAPATSVQVETPNGAARDEAPMSAAAGAAKKKPSRRLDQNIGLYPEHWLANIRVMLRENRHDEALRSLDEFRRTYPDYHLPDDLRALK